MNSNSASRFGTTWISDHFDGETAFNHMRLAFTQAMAKHPDEFREFFFIFGGRHVQMRFVGRDLAEQISRPFSHLQSSAGSAKTTELFIDLWDDTLLGDPQRFATRDPEGRWFQTTLESSDGRYIAQQLPNTFGCLDRNCNYITAAITWHDRIFIYERAKPLSRLLLEWFNSQDLQIIHTGLVAYQHEGLLFVGKSGAGKSTSSLACAAAGFGYLSEDYVGLQSCNDGSFIGHSIYNSVFLKTDHLERFPQLKPHAIRGRPPYEEKSVVLLSEVFAERLESAVPIRALVLPRIVKASEARARPASKGEALLALGPSSLLQIPNKALGVCGFNKLVHLVERTPCFWLEVGSDLKTIPKRLEEIVEDLKR
jgi:hypothetical protein